MCQKLYNMTDADSINYDKRLDNQRIECKFSRALSENQEKITEHNLLTQCFQANYERRVVKSNEATGQAFDCNIQQVKPLEFDVLYYGIFFQDKIEIYKIASQDITNIVGYSNKQHKGNTGEGQFHISNANINYHRQNTIKTLDYKELYLLFGGTEN